METDISRNQSSDMITIRGFDYEKAARELNVCATAFRYVNESKEKRSAMSISVMALNTIFGKSELTSSESSSSSMALVIILIWRAQRAQDQMILSVRKLGKAATDAGLSMEQASLNIGNRTEKSCAN